MKRQYFALKASLPMLLFDAAPPISSEEFLSCCEAFLPPDRMKFLRALTLSPRELPEFEKDFKRAAIPSKKDIRTDDSRVMQLYSRWEISLRNTLARLRAAKLGQDPEANVVKYAAFDSAADTAARNAFSLTDPMEKELALDRARWDFLTGLEWSHAFNFEALCIYRCKLMILEKWAARRDGNAAANLDAAAAKAEKSTEQTQK